MSTKQVLVVRKDLNMRKGKIAAQCAHASLGSVTKFFTRSIFGNYKFNPSEEMEDWLFGGPLWLVDIVVDSFVRIWFCECL